MTTPIQRDTRRGRITINGRVLFDSHDHGDKAAHRNAVTAVAFGHNDDHWRRIAEITEPVPTPHQEPLQGLLCFFLERHDDAFPGEWRDDVCQDAYEAAREVIVTAIEQRTRHTLRNLPTNWEPATRASPAPDCP